MWQTLHRESGKPLSNPYDSADGCVSVLVMQSSQKAGHTLPCRKNCREKKWLLPSVRSFDIGYKEPIPPSDYLVRGLDPRRSPVNVRFVLSVPNTMRKSGLAYMKAFVEEIKATGAVAAMIARHSIRGINVAPAATR